MRRSRPQQLAIWLLERLTADREPLIGDLVEELRTRPSHLRLWREVLFAMLNRSRENTLDVRLLKISEARSPVEIQPRVGPSRGPAKSINLSGGPVPGVGGLSVVALAALLTLVSPQIWWLAVCCALVGLVLGVALAILRRREGLRVTGDIFSWRDADGGRAHV